MVGVYDLKLVALSLVVAAFASYTALELAGRVSATQGRTSWLWLLGGAFAMGTGIWSMHFIGMLAFRLPIPMAYDVWINVLSWVIAMGASGVALFVVRRPTLTGRNITIGAAVMGAGICSMHYIGMAAMRMSPPIVYHPPLFTASLIIAIAASLAALWIAFQLRKKRWALAILAKLASALVMALAITGMHYTGMAAAQFAPGSVCLAADTTGGLDSASLAVLVSIATLAILTITVVISGADVQEREAKIRRLVDANIIGIFIWELDGQILEANDAFLRMVRHDREDLASGRIRWKDLTPPEWLDQDARRLVPELNRAGSVQPYEKEYFRKDGSRVPVLVGAATFEKGGNQGVAFVLDLSEGKRAEAERVKLEERLRQAEKMEAIGAMAGGIAHDFNNILGAILGYGELAQKSAAEGSAVRRYSDNVMHAAGRAKALVERILAFSRSGIGERAPVNVQAVIAETLDLLAASLPGRVQLDRKLDAGDAAVIADATQFHQVVMNLCTNAVQAMPAGGVLEVRFERVEVAERVSVFQGELALGPYVRLTVRDSGTGIEPQVLDRMFDPFFTTKGVGVGTGLGLSLVHGIVADVGGAIDVATAIDEGTTFTIWMPVAGAAPAPKAEVASELPHGNGEVIMVVDDEPSLVALTEEMLAELGYEPIGFGSATAALKAFVDDPGRFDLVLTDEMMPELSGTGLALEIRRLRANIPIVIMSGYVDTSVAALARSAGVSDVLRKPLQSRDIAEALARVLPVSGAATATAG
jgi:PAS domain S-box-containing protein